MRRVCLLLPVIAFSLAAQGCAPLVSVGVHALSRHAALPESLITRDIAYVADGANNPAHRLDLYRAKAPGGPVLVFVHGGGWDSGDKQLRVGGVDVYANIGRFYAAHGITTAVINYRLQPATDWRGQVDDVRAAAHWMSAHASEWGSASPALFLMGHSAGGHLIAEVALDPSARPVIALRGAISVSGAALDLTDARTYELGEDVRYYAKRFRGADSTQAWRAAASPAALVTGAAPPFLVLCAAGESKGLQRQAQVFADVLAHAGVPVQRVVVPGESHSRMVLVLARADKAAVPAILRFLREH